MSGSGKQAKNGNKASSPPAVPKHRGLRSDRASLCFKQHRTVAKDNTVTFEGTVFHIPKPSPHRSYAISESRCMCF